MTAPKMDNGIETVTIKVDRQLPKKSKIIKLVNKLESDSISPGTKLRILAKKEKLEELNN